MIIEVLYLPKNVYPQNKFLATSLAGVMLFETILNSRLTLEKHLTRSYQRIR